MQLEKDLEKHTLEIYKKWLKAYLNADVKTYDYYFDDRYHFIGSTNNEEFLNRKDTTLFFEQTADQLSGKCDLRNESYTLEKFESQIFITHIFDAWFLNEGNYTYYGKFRFSSIMREKNGDWKFIYQHFSTPDSKTEKGDTIGFDKVNKENRELREAIQRRTFELETKNRELEIEAALEKIRSRSLAMHKSDELLDVIGIVSKQVHALGLKFDTICFGESNRKGAVKFWLTSKGLPKPILVDVPPIKNKAVHRVVKAQKDGLKFLADVVTGNTYTEFNNHMLTHSQLQFLPEAARIYLKETSGFARSSFFLKEIALYVMNYKIEPFSDVDNAIFNRFAQVFDQSYTRFLDLQKAEAQAREAKIEAALEKVRSRSLSMQKSQELRDVVLKVHDKFQELDISMESRVAVIVVFEEHGNNYNQYIASKVLENILISTPYFEHKVLDDFWTARETGVDFYSKAYTIEEKNSYFKTFYEVSKFERIPETEAMFDWAFAQQYYSYSPAFQENSSLGIADYSGVPLTNDEIEIIKRFSKVFEQAYIRFLDLQKAEAQTLEAKIENALEKVRSRTMAMQNSEELPEAANVLFSEVQNLGIPTWSAGYNILSDDKTKSLCIMSSEGQVQIPFTLPLTDHYTLKPWHESILNKKEFAVFEFNDTQIIEHYAYMQSLPELKSTFEQLKDADIPLPTFQVNHLAKFSSGFLLFITYEKVPKAHSIFKRFTKVFEQTYTRFLDLQKAEQRARESQIETALERVRSHSMGMQSTADFGAVTTEMFNQLRNFGEDLFATGIVFCDKHEGHVEQWHSIPKAGMLSPFIVPVNLDYIHQYRYDQWKAGRELFSIEIPSDFIEEHFQDIFNLPSAQIALKALKEMDAPMPAAPLYEIDYGASFKNGYILISSLKEFENPDILPRFAKVFEQAYTRFLDLQKAEEQARQSQIEAALEKIRSRSLSMQSPDELKEVVKLIAEKLKELDVILDLGGVIICTYFQNSKDIMHWIAASDSESSGKFLLPYFDHVILNEAWASKNSGDKWFSKAFSTEEKNTFFKHAFEHSDYKYFPDEAKAEILGRENHMLSFAWNKHSALLIPSYSEVAPSDKEKNILIRFSRVFEQAYIRFLDLQKAEAQAKEAKIQLALERVRAKTMAMQHSNELVETSELLFRHIKELGIELWSCGYSLWFDDDSYFMGYNPMPDGKMG